MNLASVAWQPLEVSGQTLQPNGHRTSPSGRDVWMWSGDTITLAVHQDPAAVVLVLTSRAGPPTAQQLRASRQALGLERARLVRRSRQVQEGRHVLSVVVQGG